MKNRYNNTNSYKMTSHTTIKVVQIFFSGSDDAQHDYWYDICTNLIPDDDVFHRVIAIFERVGQHLMRHVLITPRQYIESDDLTAEELKKIRDFEPQTYKSFEPQKGVPCVITGRYCIKYD